MLSQLSDVALVQSVLDTFCEEKCRTLARAFVRNQTWQVPTLIRIRTIQVGNDPIYRADPNLKYVAPSTRAMLQDVAQEYELRVPATVSCPSWGGFMRRLLEAGKSPDPVAACAASVALKAHI